MRILLGVHQFYPKFRAGTETLTLATARQLLRRGHSVEVWTGFPADRHLPPQQRIDRYRLGNLPVVRYRHSFGTIAREQNVIESEYFNRYFRARFGEALDARRPNVAHFFHLGRLSASALEACRERGIPTVFTATDFWFMCPTSQLRLPDNSLCLGPDRSGVNCLRHVVEITQPERERAAVRGVPAWALRLGIWGSRQSWWPERKYSPLIRALADRPARLRALFRGVDRILAPTHLMARFLAGWGVDPGKIVLAPYGVADSVRRATPQRRRRRTMAIGFVGTLAEHKGPHILVEAFRKLPRARPLRLRIYGSLDEFPEYGERLRSAAKADDRIEFPGRFPNTRIGAVMRDLDVLVIPSMWYENTPLVAYSAQAAGTPLVASDVGGLGEVVEDEVNGLLFPMGDAEALALALGRLVEDRGLVGRLAANAVAPRTAAAYAEQCEAIYRELVPGRVR